MTQQIDVAKARKRPWTKKELFLRFLWVGGSLLSRCSPRPFFELRNWILRMFGGKIGRNVHIYPTTRIMIPWNLKVGDNSTLGDRAEIYNLGAIEIGENVTISQRAHLCAGTHNHNDTSMPLLKKGIQIGDNAWICADAFVGPGVCIGEGAVLGARAVAVKNVDPWAIMAGNPARLIALRKLSK